MIQNFFCNFSIHSSSHPSTLHSSIHSSVRPSIHPAIQAPIQPSVCSSKKIKNNKAPEENGLVIEFMKIGRPILLNKIKTLYNMYVYNAPFLQKWNNAITLILLKKVNRTNLTNYRLLNHLY